MSDHVVRTYPDGSKMCWSGGSGHWPCDVADLRARLAAVEALCDDWDSNGNATMDLSAASVWHKASRQARAAARGEGQ